MGSVGLHASLSLEFWGLCFWGVDRVTSEAKIEVPICSEGKGGCAVNCINDVGIYF
ncbi:hypothetical protein CA13_12080 [Planctomycetes bacterium CA13]|uniref:Uncharacterized protein n=1 Tax=Novipirellula herctigrandis TaxID=2527986 RepID=A0A5C5YZ14_9BACT|nr:hypothetical protein CA13_12080 [Planctomycetes bacterium CA13]